MRKSNVALPKWFDLCFDLRSLFSQPLQLCWRPDATHAADLWAAHQRLRQSFSALKRTDRGDGQTTGLLARFAEATRQRNALSDANGFVWSEYIFDPKPNSTDVRRRAYHRCDARLVFCEEDR